MVHLDIDRPTKGLDVELTYDPQQIGQMRVLDFASIGEGGRTSQESGTPTLRYRYDGWLFPRAGLVFVWTLPDEQNDWPDGVSQTDGVASTPKQSNHDPSASDTDDDVRQASAA